MNEKLQRLSQNFIKEVIKKIKFADFYWNKR